MTSTLAFDIAQFFLFLNYQLLLLILAKVGFNFRISSFFSYYLIGRSATYQWNDFFSSSFNVGVGIGQSFALSPILSALYLSLIFYIFEKRIKNLKIPVSFVDDRLIVFQNTSLAVLNFYLFCSYYIMYSLLRQFGLIIEHEKIEVFYFSRSYSCFEPPFFNLITLGGPILHPKEIWHYLGFIFNRKLMFRQHINFYANKVLSTIKCMKMLGNLSRGLIPTQKWCLHISYTLFIVLYRFQLWYYNKVQLVYLLKELRKMQIKATIWILGAFCTSLSLEIEAVIELLPIYLHLQKLSSKFQLKTHTLSPGHIIKLLLESKHTNDSSIYWASLERLMPRQQLLLKKPVVDANNRLNGIFPFFDSFSNEFSSGNRLIDIFTSCISLHLTNRKNKKSRKAYIWKLDKITLKVSLDFKTAVIILDASIKN